MYGIGDMVVYGSDGVMTVVDIREELFGAERRKYFVLKPVFGNVDSLTFVSMDNERLVGAIRRLITRETAQRLVDGLCDIPETEWITDNRARAEAYKKILESGRLEDTVGVIKAICSSVKRRLAEGKKNFLSDENILRKAERAVASELALVLGIDEVEARALIEERLF